MRLAKEKINMKANRFLVGLAILVLILATAASVFVWEEIPSAVKIGMFAFGFGSGVVVGPLLARRST